MYSARKISLKAAFCRQSDLDYYQQSGKAGGNPFTQSMTTQGSVLSTQYEIVVPEQNHSKVSPL